MLTRLKAMAHVRSIGAFFIVACILLYAPFVIAQESSSMLALQPVVIDEKAKPRDILKETLTIKNNANRKLNLYPAVNDIDIVDGEQVFIRAQNSPDRAVSLANWVELSRGVIELQPGEEKTIPFVIRVHLNAAVGSYHAVISFGEGNTRETAEAQEPLARLMVNVEVTPDVKEVLQLNTFFSDNFFLAGDDILFNYQLENIGNQSIAPTGEIRIYDRKGKEVATVDVNKDGDSIAPDQISQLASVWSAVSGFGRYKAFLNVDYGSAQKASVQDSIYFWIIPWQQLVGLISASLIAIVFLALYFHRRFEMHHAARLHAALAQHGHPAAMQGAVPVATAATPQAVEAPQPSWFARLRSRLPRRAAHDDVLSTHKPRLSEALEGSHMQPEKTSGAQPHAGGAHAIDLKNMGSAPVAQPKHHEQHVINLKM